jgi:hypothetical protein
MEMIRLEEPVLAMAPAIQRNPIQRPFSEREFLGGVAGEADARDQGVLEPRAKRSLCLVKVASGKILLARRSANGNAVQFHSRAGRVAGELQFFSVATRRAGEQQYDGAD